MNGYISWLIIIAYLVRGNGGKFIKIFDLATFTTESAYLKPSAIISLKHTLVPRYLYKHQPISYSKNINMAEVLSRNNNNIKVSDIRRNDDIDLGTLSPDEQHKYKVKNIADFILHHRLTANYFYEEMKRIKRQRKVRDKLRKMVMILEHVPSLKEAMLKTFNGLLQKIEKVPKGWSQKTNQLYANIINF